MKKPLVVKPLVFARLAALAQGDRNACWDALLQLAETFGQPHVHSGIGIRKLGQHLFECRGNRDLRFIFQDRGAELYVSFLGNHDEIQALLRRGNYR